MKIQHENSSDDEHYAVNSRHTLYINMISNRQGCNVDISLLISRAFSRLFTSLVTDFGLCVNQNSN